MLWTNLALMEDQREEIGTKIYLQFASLIKMPQAISSKGKYHIPDSNVSALSNHTVKYRFKKAQEKKWISSACQ